MKHSVQSAAPAGGAAVEASLTVPWEGEALSPFISVSAISTPSYVLLYFYFQPFHLHLTEILHLCWGVFYLFFKEIISYT